jgi:hypothetical protein
MKKSAMKRRGQKGPRTGEAKESAHNTGQKLPLVLWFPRAAVCDRIGIREADLAIVARDRIALGLPAAVLGPLVVRCSHRHGAVTFRLPNTRHSCDEDNCFYFDGVVDSSTKMSVSVSENPDLGAEV